jgi:hypothetical protein
MTIIEKRILEQEADKLLRKSFKKKKKKKMKNLKISNIYRK